MKTRLSAALEKILLYDWVNQSKEMTGLSCQMWNDWLAGALRRNSIFVCSEAQFWSNCLSLLFMVFVQAVGLDQVSWMGKTDRLYRKDHRHWPNYKKDIFPLQDSRCCTQSYRKTDFGLAEMPFKNTTFQMSRFATVQFSNLTTNVDPNWSA